jgi:hypothetical protein
MRRSHHPNAYPPPPFPNPPHFLHPQNYKLSDTPPTQGLTRYIPWLNLSTWVHCVPYVSPHEPAHKPYRATLCLYCDLILYAPVPPSQLSFQLLQDYQLSDIALLRRTCQAGGGVTVSTRTVGGRDAIYKAAVDAAVRRCVQRLHSACQVAFLLHNGGCC